MAKPKKREQRVDTESKGLHDRRVTPTFMVRIPLELADAIDKMAADQFTDRTKVIVGAVVKHLRETGYLPAVVPPARAESPSDKRV